ncbi:flagellar protein FlaG [Brevibacillus sp. GCM10020057]|uniref:flagellar protein FlaG n=1 Tax=Brevibacillus sp. GCM10020057 TaxID=3317327 RepID=UPI003645A12E
MEIKTVGTTFFESSETSAMMEQGAERRVNGRAASDSDSFQGVPQKKDYTQKEISKELEHLNKWAEMKSSHLKFVLHDRLNEYYVQVVSDSTNEVIKEIPSKKFMDMVANFYEKLGLIVDKKA